MEDYIDQETGEIISSTILALQQELERTVAEQDALKAMCHSARTALAAVHHEAAALRVRLATASTPEGRLRVRGRLVQLPGSAVAVVVAGGRVVRMTQVAGWDQGIEDGVAVAAEAILDARRGWVLWRVRPLADTDAEAVPAVPPALYEKLTAAPSLRDPADKLAAIEEIDKDAGGGVPDLRREAHHVSSLSAHICLVRWRRGKDMPLSDEMASRMKLEIQSVIEETLGWKLLAVNTGSLDNRHKHDHVHIAASRIAATQTLSREVGRLKAIVSKRMRTHFPELLAWEHFFGAGMYLGSFGGPNTEALKSYIANQDQ